MTFRPTGMSMKKLDVSIVSMLQENTKVKRGKVKVFRLGSAAA